jgi:phosphoribosylformylglycinamidine (FGAM) synthase-like amidotransferase family enzyme
MKFGIVVFPGSNCDRDMQDSLQNDLNQEVVMLWHKDKDLSMSLNCFTSFTRTKNLDLIQNLGSENS